MPGSQLLLASAAGAVAGFASSFLVAAWPVSHGKLGSERALESFAHGAPEPERELSRGEWQTMVERVTRLEQERSAARAVTQMIETPKAPLPANASADTEQQRARRELALTAAVRAASTESVDPSWAPPSERALREDLQRVASDLSSTRVGVVAVECHTISCLATLEWPSFEIAKAGWRQVLQSRFQMHCARSLMLPVPADPSRPYRATAVFDCAEARVEAEN